MSAYDELDDEMVALLMKKVIETDRAYNYNFDDICTGAKIAIDSLKAENERLAAWRVSEGHLLGAANARLHEVAVACATAEQECDQLRAEVAGLKTGYQAYERVNAELKAELKALRQDAERYKFLMLSFVGDEGSPPAGYYVIYEDGSGFGEILCGDEATREVDAAMAKGDQP